MPTCECAKVKERNSEQERAGEERLNDTTKKVNEFNACRTMNHHHMDVCCCLHAYQCCYSTIFMTINIFAEFYVMYTILHGKTREKEKVKRNKEHRFFPNSIQGPLIAEFIWLSHHFPLFSHLTIDILSFYRCYCCGSLGDYFSM